MKKSCLYSKPMLRYIISRSPRYANFAFWVTGPWSSQGQQKMVSRIGWLIAIHREKTFHENANIYSNFKIDFHNWYQFHLQDISFLITFLILYLNNVSQPQWRYKSWYACLYWSKKLVSLRQSHLISYPWMLNLSHPYPFQKSILLKTK